MKRVAPLEPPSAGEDSGKKERARTPVDGDFEQRPRALMSYLASLAQTREMELRVVFGGHGEPVEDHRALIEERFRMHERRADKLHGLIVKRPSNAYELAQEMWGNVAVTQAFLTLSEVLGHVDLLIDEGRVAEREDARTASSASRPSDSACSDRCAPALRLAPRPAPRSAPALHPRPALQPLLETRVE